MNFGAFAYRLILKLCGVIIVPDDSVGIVTKKFVLFGKNRRLPDGRIIALHGEAGYQADTLSPGLHVGLCPWQYSAHLVRFLTITQGQVGVVESCDGRPLVSIRMVAKEVDCDSFQDARAFLSNGGERGPQMALIPPGILPHQSIHVRCRAGGRDRRPGRQGRRGDDAPRNAFGAR